MLKIFKFFTPVLFSLSLVAQTNPGSPWSLQMCIDYALKNNLNIKQQQLNADINTATYLQSKAEILPSLNGSVSHDYNFGRFLDIGSGKFTDKQTMTENFSLSSNVTLFSGLQTYNRIKQEQYSLAASKLDVEKMRNDITLNVATAFLQILFNDELLENAKRQHDLTNQQVERTKAMVDIGARAKGDLLDMQAQLASDEVNISNSQNNLDISYLNLAQLLDLDSTGNFRIDKPQLPDPGNTMLSVSPSAIYTSALTSQPQIKSALFQQKSSERALAVAKGAISPRLTLNGNYGSRFSELNKKPVDPLDPFGPYIIIPFNDQLDQNIYKYIGLSLSVPIFNNLQTRTSIERSKISVLNAKYNLELTQNELRKTIEQAYADASGALKSYNASQRSVEAMEEATKYAEEKFNVGAVSALDYNDMKNRLNRSKSDLLQAKYNYIFKSKVLDFYMGKPIGF